MAQSVGAIALDIVAGKNTLNSTIKSSMNEAQDTVNSGSSIISKALGGIGSVAKTVGKVTAVGLGVAKTAVVALGKSAISAYADYEQLTGGVETLFGTGGKSLEEYAKSVGKSVEEAKAEYEKLEMAQRNVFVNSAKAFETAGMSQNEYMETVTSFSAALISSLDGDTVKAAEVADRAIIDMADNANKMGTSMEMIQNAYNGFAKGNMTMLDNLKLGYGGTQEEMKRLISDASKMKDVQKELNLTVDEGDMSFGNIVNAISVMQKNMGIAGATADEAASTISGSIGMMKGAWQNLLTGMGDETQDFGSLIDQFVASVETVGTNLFPRIEVVLGGVINLVQGLAPKIIQKLPQLTSQLLPKIITAATSLVNAIVTVIPDLIKSIVAQIPAFIQGMVQISNALISELPTVARALVEALPSLTVALIDGLVQMAVLLCEMTPQIIQPIIDNLPETLISIVDSLISNLPSLIQGLISLTMGIVQAIPQITQALVDAAPTVVNLVISGLITCVPQLVAGLGQVVLGVVTSLPQIFASLIEGISGIFVEIWNGIVEIFDVCKTWFPDTFGEAWEAIKSVFSLSAVGEFFSGIWDGITGAFGSVTGWFEKTFSKAWKAVKDVFSTGGEIFENIKEGIADCFFIVVNGIIGGINKVIKIPFDAINSVLDGIKGISIVGLKPFSWVPTIPVPQIPELQWNAIAMDEPRIFEKPTVYGYNPSAGAYQGAGDAGSEVVSGTNTLMNMIKVAVASVLNCNKMTVDVPELQNVRAGIASSENGLGEKIDKLVELFKQFVDADNESMNVPIYIGNELIDEYILNKSNRNVLRSGGRA